MDDHVSDIDRSTVGTMLARFGAALVPLLVALGRVLWRRPLDSVGVIIAAAATMAIFVNALFLQASRHPAPMLISTPRPLGTVGSTAAAPLPPARPAERDGADASARNRIQVVSDIQRELQRRGFFEGLVDGIYGARTDAAIRDFEQATGSKTNAQPDEALLRAIMRTPVQPPATTATVMPRPAPFSRAAPVPPAPIPPAGKAAPASKRLQAVQRALGDFGYGQVKPTGVFGPETRSAIEQFERERKLPVTGQLSDRLTRELAAVTGRPLD